MDFSVLKQRALEIRLRYEELETVRSGKPWTREQIMQGFVGDVGQLMKLIMAKEGLRSGEDVDQKLAHEFSDCLYCLLVLSQKYDVNIESSFLQTMDELEKRIRLDLK